MIGVDTYMLLLIRNQTNNLFDKFNDALPWKQVISPRLVISVGGQIVETKTAVPHLNAVCYPVSGGNGINETVNFLNQFIWNK